MSDFDAPPETTNCPQCGAQGAFSLREHDIDTDLCIVCYRDSVVGTQHERTAWRCGHCKLLNSWLKREYRRNDHPFCDELCADARDDLRKAVGSS